MKRSKVSKQQFAFILRQAEEGVPIGEVCWKVGISEQTYYRWRKRSGAGGRWGTRTPRSQVSEGVFLLI